MTTDSTRRFLVAGLGSVLALHSQGRDPGTKSIDDIPPGGGDGSLVVIRDGGSISIHSKLLDGSKRLSRSSSSKRMLVDDSARGVRFNLLLAGRFDKKTREPVWIMASSAKDCIATLNLSGGFGAIRVDTAGHANGKLVVVSDKLDFELPLDASATNDYVIPDRGNTTVSIESIVFSNGLTLSAGANEILQLTLGHHHPQA